MTSFIFYSVMMMAMLITIIAMIMTLMIILTPDNLST